MNIAWDYSAPATWEGHVAGDDALPQAARFRRGERPLAVAASALGLDLGEEAGGLLSVCYQPGRSLEIVQRAGGRSPVEAVRVRCVPRSELPRELLAMKAAAPDPRDVVALPGWGAIASTAAADPGLPALRALAREEADVCLVSYMPGRRAVLRVTRADGETSFARIDARAGAAARRALARRVWLLNDRGFLMPEPQRADAQLGVCWDGALDGVELATRYATRGPEAAVQAAAQILAAMHHVPVWKDLRPAGAGVFLASLERSVVPGVYESLPTLGPQAEAIVQCLRNRLGGLPLGPAVTLHGDPHATNVLSFGDETGVLDVEDLCVGDPEFDLAVFGSRLLLLALSRQDPLEPVVEAVCALPDAYAAAGGRRIHPDAYSWYLAAALVGRQVTPCVRDLPPQVAEVVWELLGLALRFVGRPMR